MFCRGTAEGQDLGARHTARLLRVISQRRRPAVERQHAGSRPHAVMASLCGPTPGSPASPGLAGYSRRNRSPQPRAARRARGASRCLPPGRLSGAQRQVSDRPCRQRSPVDHSAAASYKSRSTVAGLLQPLRTGDRRGVSPKSSQLVALTKGCAHSQTEWKSSCSSAIGGAAGSPRELGFTRSVWCTWRSTAGWLAPV